MKIATYNVWNEDKGSGNRFEQLVHEISAVSADIIGLQEVTPYFYENYLIPRLGYPYHVFGKYTDEEEGLAVLSRYPVLESCFLHEHEEHGHSNALSLILEIGKERYRLPMSTSPGIPRCKRRGRYARSTNIYINSWIRLGYAYWLAILMAVWGAASTDIWWETSR